MKKLMFVCACLVGLTQLGWSQNSNMRAMPGAHGHGIPGYLDPQTGTFTAKVQAEAQHPENPDAPPPTLTEAFGVWNIQITIVDTTVLATGDIVVCQGALSVSDTYPAFGYEEDAAVAAKVSGGAGSCTVTMPYQWYLATPNSDTVTVSYSVSVIHMYTVGSVNQASEDRFTSHVVGTVAVPVNGTHSTTPVTARI
jgi:hypothetical protein